MGLFKKATPAPAVQDLSGLNLAELSDAHYDADQKVKLAGLQHYQDLLRAGLKSLPREHRAKGWAVVNAVVIPEPDNPHDPDAIRVVIGGHTIGYIFKDAQASFRPPAGFDGWMIGALLTFSKGGGKDTYVKVQLAAHPDVTVEA